MASSFPCLSPISQIDCGCLGKSTTLKSECFWGQFAYGTYVCVDFRLKYSPEEWEAERGSWRSVVQLNIVRSIITILRVIEAAINGDAPVDSDEDDVSEEDMRFTDRHQLLMIRLAPLLGVETKLKHRLGAGTSPLPATNYPMSATPFELSEVPSNVRRKQEFSVRSWNDVLIAENRAGDAAGTADDSVTDTLSGCKQDMKALWDDKAVRSALQRRRIQLNDTAGL